MIDSALLRNEPDRLKQALCDRNAACDFDELLSLDRTRRKLGSELENLNRQKNKINDEISLLLRDKKDAGQKIAGLRSVSERIDALKPKADREIARFEEKMLLVPNIPSPDCPVGKDASANRVVKERKPAKKPGGNLGYTEIADRLDLVDFKRAAKISGAAFVLFTGAGARLERALINFMLDTHTRSGYREMSPPFLVRRSCMQGTGQLPKFEEDLYRIYRGSDELEKAGPTESDLFLVPTAEVPITNIHRDECLEESELPLSYVAYTPCFRLEAGAYGRDTKGMIRVHQFDKVELVKFTRPEDSGREHEKLLADAEKIFQLLEIPYRVVLLSTGDLGFAAAKCYDIEVWAPALGRWLEASSCSNFGDFQARRSGIKVRGTAAKKTRFVHTLNGSGVALARTFIALLENHQQPDGSVLIPEPLRPYMDGLTHIKKR